MPDSAENVLRRTLRDSAMSGQTFGKIAVTSVVVLAENARVLCAKELRTNQG